MTELEEYEKALEDCAYKEEKDLSDYEKGLWESERASCQISFLQFLKWVRIVNPPIPGQTGEGIIQCELYPHTKEFIRHLLKDPLITVLKARQVFVSTTIAQYVLWFALSHVGANILLFSKGQPEAKELLAKAHRIYDLLPRFMKLKLDPDSTEELGFPSMQSQIKAFPSTTSAGISYTASIVVTDEHAFHPYADENFTSSQPTRDGGGQYISVSTAEPYSNDNCFTSIFEDARVGRNDYTYLFFPWDVVPARDNEWYERTKRNIPDRELGKLSPGLYMSKNYPATIEEALSMAESVAVFDKSVLNVMSDDVRAPLPKVDGVNIDFCNVYKKYHIGNKYIAATDVSLGVGQDFNVTVVMDVKTGDIVADIMSQFLAPEEIALHSVQLLTLYHNPLWWIEQNLWGRTVIKKAAELGYRKLGYRGEKEIHWLNISDDDLRRVGFVTQEQSRIDLFGALIPAINDRQIQIYNLQGLKQFYTMVRNANKDGKIEAMSGQHDDYVIATGIANLKRGDVVGSNERVKTISSLDFSGVVARR